MQVTLVLSPDLRVEGKSKGEILGGATRGVSRVPRRQQQLTSGNRVKKDNNEDRRQEELRSHSGETSEGQGSDQETRTNATL